MRSYWVRCVVCVAMLSGGPLVAVGSAQEDGDLRLQGGTALKGRLEIYHNDQWGTVCDDLFTTANAEVACRQLGHTGGTFYTAGGGTGPIWLDNVQCRGNETRVDACRHNGGWGWHDCVHGEDVGVACAGAPHPPPPAPLTVRFDPAPPATHTGSEPFTVQLRFSAEVTLAPRAFKRHGLTVTGGTVARVQQVQGQRSLWRVTIQPTTATTDVTLTVPAHRACRIAGAFCTADGQQLSAPLTHTVRGQPQPLLLQAPQRALRRVPGVMAPLVRPDRDLLAMPDAVLHAALRQALDIAPDVALTAADLVGVTTLDLSGAGISDLRGLEQARNLETLFLGGNQIIDLNPLAGLAHLKSLSLGGNQITDLRPLAGLVELEFLSLADNRITDLSPLAALVGLEFLFVAGNRITDFSPLAGLPRVSIDGQAAQGRPTGAE